MAGVTKPRNPEMPRSRGAPGPKPRSSLKTAGSRGIGGEFGAVSGLDLLTPLRNACARETPTPTNAGPPSATPVVRQSHVHNLIQARDEVQRPQGLPMNTLKARAASRIGAHGVLCAPRTAPRRLTRHA